MFHAIAFTLIVSDAQVALGLTADERDLAVKLALEAIKVEGLHKGRIVLTHLEAFRDTRVADAPPKVQVVHYRYDGNLTIFTSVDLGKGKATKVEGVPNLPTSLAPEEIAHAEKLARGHPEVRKALARQAPLDKLETDIMVAISADPKSPIYQHRAVRLFFRQGREYLLYGPTVEVDLTTETVRVFAAGSSHK